MLVSTKGNSEAGLTTLAVGLASGIPGEALAGVTGGEGPGPGTSQALNSGAGEGSVPSYSHVRSLTRDSPVGDTPRQVLADHGARPALTVASVSPGIQCTPERQRPARAEAGESGSLGTSIWRLRSPCPPAPPLHQGGQRPQRPPPRLHGSLACRETPRSSGTMWLPGSSSSSGTGCSRKLVSV